MSSVCCFCGNKNFKEALTQYIYKHDGKFLAINGVPCRQCAYCGEQYFEGSVLKCIEEKFNEIHLCGRKAEKEMRVPVEEFVDLQKA